ncbi:MAG: DUF1343 domain-containing protein [Elusimicrobiota bacterium]|jgi:uncharacterized protein YbbC (DUF1343 family)
MKAFLLAALFSLPCARAASAQGVLTGIDVLEAEDFLSLRGKRVGLITNPTGKDRQGRSTALIFAERKDLELVRIFSPEHGITGTSEDEGIASSSITLAGRMIPVRSLYSGGLAGMRPKTEDLGDLDAVIFDVQDIGVRFYTYLTSMGMALEETAKAGVEFIVLDRPDPIGGEILEGPVLKDLSMRKETSTAYYPVPIRHGMSAGEIALMYNEEVRHPRLRVVKLQGWSRKQWYDQTGLPWTPPSPNIPDLDAAALYPGIGLFEASNISVGRGTPIPFGWIGAPWLDAEGAVKRLRKMKIAGAEFSVQEYTPSKSVFAGKPCRGVRITVKDREKMRPVLVFLGIAETLKALHPEEFQWDWKGALHMTGTEDLQEHYEEGDFRGLKTFFEKESERFAEQRKPFLLYD